MLYCTFLKGYGPSEKALKLWQGTPLNVLFIRTHCFCIFAAAEKLAEEMHEDRQFRKALANKC